jgi:hypothetical protein
MELMNMIQGMQNVPKANSTPAPAGEAASEDGQDFSALMGELLTALLSEDANAQEPLDALFAVSEEGLDGEVTSADLLEALRVLLAQAQDLETPEEWAELLNSWVGDEAALEETPIDADLKVALQQAFARIRVGQEAPPLAALEKALLSAVEAEGAAREKNVFSSESAVAPKPTGLATFAPPTAGTQEAGPGTSSAASNSAPPTEIRATLETVDVHTLRNVRYLLAQGGKTISIRLVPESLGEMHIEVHTRGDEMVVRLASANPAVREALESQIPSLRQALQKEQDAPVEIQVTVDLSQGRASDGNDRREAFKAALRSGHRGAGREIEFSEARRPEPSPGASASGLNLFI